LISDFKILSQIGVFAALGITFAFLFVHIVFPKIFPAMPPARRAPNVFLQTAVDALAAPARWKFVSAVIFAAVMLVFARPVFNVDMRAMNSVSPETIAAENKLQETWGNLSGQCYVLLEAASLGELQKKNEQLAALLADEVRQEKLAPVFLPSVLFPSPLSAENNIAAWQRFWNKDRIAALERELDAAAVENGFAPEAFEPFRKMIGQAFPEVSGIPGQYFEMLGIARTSDGYAQLSLLTTGKNYDAGDLWNRLSRSGLADFFDVDLFNQKLGEFLKKIFFEIAFIVSAGLILIIFVFFMDWRLSLAVLSPVVFALVATLGTLKMIGHPLDIPGIMLWIVIMGMGIDYSIYYTCTYQRHPEDRAPAMRTIRLSMGLAACTTLIGFGVLTLARHPLLASIGLVSLFGIGYSLAGAYLILPFLLKKIFSPEPFPSGAFTVGSREHRRRTVLRYRHLPGYPRIFARFKMMMDPMFQEVDQYVQNPRRMMDIGCGFGVPAAWLMEMYPQAKVFGLEPDEERVLIASRAWGDRGRAQTGGAPDLPEVEGSVDHVLMLDMLHLITDEELALVLGRIYNKLATGGNLLIRATVPSERKIPWNRWIEAIRLQWTGTPERFRREEEIAGFMNAAGFSVVVHASL
jgi:SAM-dependent methyltransferase